MNQGKIIEYIDQGRFVCSLCLQDKGNRLHLLTTLNREVNLSPKRAILISGTTLDVQRPREELLENLKRAEAMRKNLQDQVNAKELWELITDEKERFDHKYLAQLTFGETISDEHVSGLVRALFEDHLYFRLKDGRFQPNPTEGVDRLIKQKEEEALIEQRLIQESAWLKRALEGKKVRDTDCRANVIGLLTQLSLYGNEAPDFKYGKKLLMKAEIPHTDESRRLLVKLGVWDEDENLDLHRSDIEISFNKKQLDETARLIEADVDYQGREDLRHLPLLTIDGALTRDFDDAISLKSEDDALHLGVHISDVASVIMPNSILDKSSAQRAVSVYMPRTQIPMLPQHLSEGSLSLKQGCDRPAVSLLTRFDKTGNLLDYRFALSVVRVRQNLTYDRVNENLDSNKTLQKLYQMGHRLREKRNKQGALNLSLPELQISYDADSSLAIELIPQDTPSRMIVAEFMIFYNWMVAKFCRDNKIPILFRTQAEPSERLSIDDNGYLYYVFKQRRKLNPLVIDTSPRPHSGLGLDVYTHATSPIRRYLDIVMQRQMVDTLNKTAPYYNEKGLDEIRIAIEPVIKAAERIKRNRIRYWILKFLSQHLGESYTALVLDELKSKYRVVFKDFLLIAEIKRDPRFILHHADRILVKVKKADAWSDTLDLTYTE